MVKNVYINFTKIDRLFQLNFFVGEKQMLMIPGMRAWEFRVIVSSWMIN